LDTRRRNVLLAAGLIVFLAFFTTVETSLGQPLTSQVIVKMDNSPGVDIASKTLAENMPDSVVVDYNSLAYRLDIWRAYSGVIWVGHGSQQSINTEQGPLTWKAFATQISSAPSKDVVLACNSASILNYTLTGQVAMAFRGEVDAELGALVVAYRLTGNKAVLPEFLSVAEGLLRGEAKLMPLMIVGGGGGSGGSGSSSSTELEEITLLVNVVIDSVGLLSGLDPPEPTISLEWIDWFHIIWGSFAEMGSEAVEVEQGTLSVAQFVLDIGAFVVDTLVTVLQQVLTVESVEVVGAIVGFVDDVLVDCGAAVAEWLSWLVPIVGQILFVAWLAGVIYNAIQLCDNLYSLAILMGL
jgi:hypothetical protein